MKRPGNTTARGRVGVGRPSVAPLAPILAGVLALAAGMFAVGCKGGSSDGGTGGSGVGAAAGSSTRPTTADATRLKSGPAPLNYMVGPGGNLRVVDATTGKTILTTTANPQSAISIDQAKGISINGTVVMHGPLPAGHQYELWLDKPKQ
ncbi:MAG TPA: hypothetical protein VH475_13955 [Tepidisphaeraceae bacterium]|jgi:hypothetical protein